MSGFFDSWTLPATADMHVHLRDGPMMTSVTPTIKQGGVDTVFVMPNLVPPITTVSHAIEYHSRLKRLAPDVDFLMSLYLHPDISPATIREAKKSGIIYGVKSYPAGVTTNSAAGVVDYESFYPVFSAMEQEGLVLNLHGELPASKENPDITVLNAEESFLPTFLGLHQRFPNLKIVLEHCTTASAIEAVRACGPQVAGTITAHHLFLIVDDWAGDPINFCKPVAKTPRDKRALLEAATSGETKFFLGTDSAPHPLSAKRGGSAGMQGMGKCAAGVFTQPYATQLVLRAFEDAVISKLVPEAKLTRETVEGFLGRFGRKFYGLEQNLNLQGRERRKIKVETKGEKVMDALVVGDVTGTNPEHNQDVVVPFRRGQDTYSISWI